MKNKELVKNIADYFEYLRSLCLEVSFCDVRLHFAPYFPALVSICIEKQHLLIGRCHRGVFYGPCWAGVEEYVFPVKSDGEVIAFISVSGYRGKYSVSRKRAAAAAENFTLDKRNAAARYAKKLRIGTINAVYESELYPLIRGFYKSAPEIALKVVLGHSADLLRMLQDDVVDIAFSYIPLKKTGFVCRRFSSDELVLLVSPAANEYKGVITKEQLISSRYLMCNFAFGDAGEFVRSLFPPRHAFGFEIDNSSKVIDYLKDGLGCSFLPRKMAEKELAAGELEEVRLIGFSAPEIVSYCSYKKGNALAERLLEQA